ncbi:uncharacterized protein CELE_Y71A12B.24 [Caenorhabditis elegans]|uniref:Uncharacterized protein n=1 Tax=Caenorhabditis elegans TaxID=6239 RepID=E0R7L0_CAEEL|nr:Uncharacterized protein CELE_Y71A12B.24 [Caenorhabditis elegans]CBW48331.1 Uncharacterized protein CELE_Y71A12B.24 [Caenorhabditis elegans]|eukprot:NP_001252257.1 Uncharacterized protein CELE_Y71A12B.24 [Caenorhabditis elegans]
MKLLVLLFLTFSVAKSCLVVRLINPSCTYCSFSSYFETTTNVHKFFINNISTHVYTATNQRGSSIGCTKTFECSNEKFSLVGVTMDPFQLNNSDIVTMFPAKEIEVTCNPSTNIRRPCQA